MVRFAKKEDIPEIVPLILVILRDMELPFLKTIGEEKTLDFIAAAAEDPDYRYSYQRGIVKEIDGKIAGVAFGYPSKEEKKIDQPFQKIMRKEKIDQKLFLNQETFPNEWYLDSIVVGAEFRGQGVGSELLAALPKLAERDGETTIGLNVDRNNPRARSLYLQYDFKDVGEKVINGHLYDHMQKTI